MTKRIKGTDGVVRHRGKGTWSRTRMEQKEKFDKNWDQITKKCKGCDTQIHLGPQEYCLFCLEV